MVDESNAYTLFARKKSFTPSTLLRAMDTMRSANSWKILTSRISLALLRLTLSKAQMVECKLKWAYRGYQITQSFPITQLTEYQYQQMIPTCKTFDILVAVVFLYQPLEVVSGKKLHNLTKNIAPLVHTYTLSPYTLHFVRRRKGKHFKTSECLNYS